jgi:single-strand DNA-binding protein
MMLFPTNQEHHMGFNNSSYFTGNLTRDPELRFTATGTAVCSFGVAWNQKKPGQDESVAHFFDCTAWSQLGENIAESFSKGDRVVIVGRLDFQSWDSNGEKRSKVGIVVEEAGPSVQWATAKPIRNERPDGNGSGRAPANRQGTGGGRQNPTPEAPLPDEEPF